MTDFLTPSRLAADCFRDLRPMIGNTPMLEIDFLFGGRRRKIYAKAENLNMTGSIKDRMAFYILQKAYQCGRIKAGDVIAEATSGNTGISFAAIGRALGHQVVIFMPDWMSKERHQLIRSLGAEIIPVSREEGGFLGSIRKCEEFAEREGNVFLPRQFSNDHNVDAHERSTGPEIWAQLQTRGIVPDAFVAGVGTGGTIMGVGKFLKRMSSRIRLHPVEPAESPTLSTGCKIGQHRIQGVSDEFIPDIVRLKALDSVVSVHDGDSILMAQQLASRLGLAVGISSGANFIAALMLQLKGESEFVATVFPDDNKKYLTTALLCEEPVKDSYLSPGVELLGYRALNRVCSACLDPSDELEELCIAPVP